MRIFGSDYGPESFISANYVEDGKYLIFTVQHGWSKSEIHFKDLNNNTSPISIIEGVDARFYTKYLDGRLYARTNYGADKNRLISIDLNNLESRDVTTDEYYLTPTGEKRYRGLKSKYEFVQKNRKPHLKNNPVKIFSKCTKEERL